MTVLRDLANESAWLRVDHARNAAALAALLTNGAQAGAEGGTVRLVVELAGDLAELSVLDDGPGLTAQDLARAFDPFFSSRARGVGLGLTRARNIARAHGGDVVLAHAVAGGTRATLVLPRAAPAGHPRDPRV